ncbi:MAG: hypothetical protein H6578_01840 [Chitinophagales bacterium]|nr:hypothetical protein [Chitinophagales bacterium]
MKYLLTEILNATDYYPFGMPMPGRSFTSESYRFGFNTQERSDEIAGSGNHYTAMFWEYNPRVVTRWNTDPITYPWQSPYTINNNNPIYYTDPLGLYGTQKKAERKQKKIAKKLDDNSRVGDVFNRNEGTDKKADWGFHVYGEGKDKYTRTGGNLEDGVEVKAYRPDASVFDNKGFKGAKSKFGLYTPWYISGNASFVFAGGASYTIGFAQDKFGGRTGFRTVGGGVGFGAGLGINSGGFRNEGNNKFRVDQLEGRGFQYVGGAWFLSGQVSGNNPEKDNFRRTGYDYTAIEGGGSLGEGYKALKWTNLSKLTNVEIGGQYQWTTTYTFWKNKVAKQNSSNE